MYLTNGKLTEKPLNVESVDIITMNQPWGGSIVKAFMEIYTPIFTTKFTGQIITAPFKKNKKK